MFPKTTTKLPEWRELFEQTEKLEVGTVLTHGEVAQILRVKYGSPAYTQHVQRWRKEEQDARNRQWRTVRKVGYELVPAHDHNVVASVQLHRSHRSVRRAMKAMQHTPMHELNTAQQQKHVNAEARIGVLVQMTAATVKEVRQIYLPTNQPPKPMLEGAK